jgi:hypothetical protein
MSRSSWLGLFNMFTGITCVCVFVGTITHSCMSICTSVLCGILKKTLHTSRQWSELIQRRTPYDMPLLRPRITEFRNQLLRHTHKHRDHRLLRRTWWLFHLFSFGRKRRCSLNPACRPRAAGGCAELHRSDSDHLLPLLYVRLVTIFVWMIHS